jgi:3-hydroxyacyl-CoA dehydrogenase/enoyl-CoA hydratase/3-hydroxybutyryl-CoA epimerase/enoyl-CoA isomerase
VDFQRIDQVMEKFGWPMGPAYLLDVVGIDTAYHAGEVMAQGFPDRMASEAKTPCATLFEARRLGQKTGNGFYNYEPDKRGIPRKVPAPGVAELLALQVRNPGDVTDQEIVDRLMLPLIIECSRCLEERIVGTAVEVDMGLVYGLGFPTFRGGALRHADTEGLRSVCARADRHLSLGKLYEPTAQMLALAEAGRTFYEEK